MVYLLSHNWIGNTEFIENWEILRTEKNIETMESACVDECGNTIAEGIVTQEAGTSC